MLFIRPGVTILFLLDPRVLTLKTGNIETW